MYLPVFLVLLVCVCVCVLCHGVHQQTNRHSEEITEVVPECDADSLSLLIHTNKHRHTSMHVCLFAFLSILDSWLPNSDSLSLLIQSYIPTCIRVFLFMYIFVLFLFVFSEYTLQLVV
jgi:hypothetical protein